MSVNKKSSEINVNLRDQLKMRMAKRNKTLVSHHQSYEPYEHEDIDPENLYGDIIIKE